MSPLHTIQLNTRALAAYTAQCGQCSPVLVTVDSGLTVLSGPHVCQALRALTAQRSSGPHVERLEPLRPTHDLDVCIMLRSPTRPVGSHISIRAGHAPMAPPAAGHNETRLPHPHTITRQARSRAKRRRPRMAASTRAHASTRTCERTCSSTTTVTARSPVTPPPQHEPARVTATSVQRSPSLLHPSGPRRQSQQPIPLTSLWPSKAEPAAHPSYIPLAPEGRASADSQAYASYCIRLSSQ